MKRDRVLIIGAAGRDFHNFNTYFRDNKAYEVVGFTAAQIPKIDDRKYPKELAGKLYPNGIKIYPEAKLEELIKKFNVDQCVLAYSDLYYMDVMHISARVNAAGADFRLLGTKNTLIPSKKPMIAICAVRTGCGKSQTARAITDTLRSLGKKTVAIRHPMPYGDLNKQRVQRFAKLEDLGLHKCTIEEREEYEPHIMNGSVVYAGVDYADILRSAEKEADIILWDGGNNDVPFYVPDLWITILDPLRPGHEMTYYPSEVNVRRADVILINKANVAKKDVVKKLIEDVKKVNPRAQIVVAASNVAVDAPKEVKGKKVLLIEDGPTLTHGGMQFGAGYSAAKEFGAKSIVDPRPYAVGSIKAAYTKYPQLGNLVPALGYYDEQIRDLEKTINNAKCDMVLVATPIDLASLIEIKKPNLRVRYDLADMGKPTLDSIIRKFVASKKKK